jgi:hypothetical protein
MEAVLGEVSGSAHQPHQKKGKAPQLVIDPDDVTLTPSKIIVKHTGKGGYFCMGFGPSAEFLRAIDEDHRFGAAIDEAEAALRKRGSAFAGNDDPFLRRLGTAVALAKDGFDPNQPRDDHGRWTGDGAGGGAADASTATASVRGGAAAATASIADNVIAVPELAPALRQLATRALAGAAAAVTSTGAVVAAGAAIVFGVLFIPINSSLSSEGTVPDAPDLGYRFDQDTGTLTLSRTNADGTKDILFSGRRGADSLFRDKNGNVIGSDLGGSVVVDPAAVPGYQSRAKDKDRANAGAAAQSVAIADTAQPKLCPAPGPDSPSWPTRSEQSLAYQEQISGLPRGLAVEFNGVSFDGCHESGDTITLIEAKGTGFLWAMTGPDSWRKNYQGLLDNMDQARRQSVAAPNIRIEWHFAEEPVANFFRIAFAKAGYSNVTVYFTPPVKGSQK